MRYIFLSIVIFLSQALYAQISINANYNALYNAGGSFFPIAGAAPLNTTKNIELSAGTPFYLDQWQKSIIIAQGGAIYKEVSVKLNLMDNNLHYLDISNKELILNTQVNEIIFQESSTGARNHFISGNLMPGKKVGWYQIVVNDTLSLVKGFKKILEQHQSYGSPVEYSINTSESYFAIFNGRDFDINKASDLLQIFPDRKKELEAQVKKNKKNLTREQQIVSIAMLINSIIK